MAEREVTVEVTAVHIATVLACNAKEAQEKVIDLVLDGVIAPKEINTVILDVQPIKEVT